MASFQTLDTDYKASLGCRGVGRLTWLKAFTRVRVDSVYDDAATGQRMRRTFRFTVDDGVVLDPPTQAQQDVSITVVLDGFKDEFRLNAHKSALPIARELFAECLWYVLRPGGAPRIVLIDGDRASTSRRCSLNTPLAARRSTTSRSRATSSTSSACSSRRRPTRPRSCTGAQLAGSLSRTI